jgi:RecB family endonuclease NucS
MLTENLMEDAIAQRPEKYLETGLSLIQRQYRVGGYIFDLLFQDRHGAKLIVELQKGTLDRNHTYKILDYYEEGRRRKRGRC